MERIKKYYHEEKYSGEIWKIERKSKYLKTAEVSRHKLSMRKKRYVIGVRPIKHLEEVLNS